jgi:hypothetical protein
MSVLEKISNELISLAYMDKEERVVRFAELENEASKLFQELPKEEAEIIDQIIKGLFAEAKEDAQKTTAPKPEEQKPMPQAPETIEVVEPMVVQTPQAIIENIEPEKAPEKKKRTTAKTVAKKIVEQKLEEEDLSFLDTIEDAF